MRKWWKRFLRLKLPVVDLSDSTKRTKWFLRAVSLLFAVILWLFVTWDGTTFGVRELKIPLRYLNVPEGYSLAKTVEEVSVRIEGRAELLDLINRNAVTAAIELKEQQPLGKFTFPVNITAPQGMRVLGCSPESVDVELYMVISRTMNPSLQLRGAAPEGLTLTDVHIVPEEVTIRGRDSEVVAVKRAVVYATESEIRSGGKALPVTLLGDEGEIEGLTPEPRTVLVSAKLTEASGRIRVPVHASVVGVPEAGMQVRSVTVSPDVVVLTGPRSALEKITELSLDEIDISGNAETLDVDIPLVSPAPGVVVAEERVKVRVELQEMAEAKTFMSVPIRLYGQGADSGWKLSPPSVAVTAEREILNSRPFDESNPPFELYVDLTNIVADRIALPVLVRNAASGVRVIRIEPPQVMVVSEP